jgi:hypothetical protein
MEEKPGLPWEIIGLVAGVAGGGIVGVCSAIAGLPILLAGMLGLLCLIVISSLVTMFRP